MPNPVLPPPGPPRPQYPGPRAGTILLWIAGVLLVGLIVVIVAGSALGFFVASHIHVEHQQHGTAKEVDVRSPFGSVSVRQNAASIASLGLPLYPGAQPLAGDQPSAFQNDVTVDNGVVIDGEKSHNARIHLQFADHQLDVSAAEFVTNASEAAVKDFYWKQLGAMGAVEERPQKNSVTEMKVKAGEGNERVVVMRPGDGGTHFLLVHVTVGHGGV